MLLFCRKISSVLVLSLVITSVSSIVVNGTNAEAKKTKKNTKPKLILKGQLKKKKLTIKTGESIKISATDANGKDISDKIVVSATSLSSTICSGSGYCIFFYLEDDLGYFSIKDLQLYPLTDADEWCSEKNGDFLFVLKTDVSS